MHTPSPRNPLGAKGLGEAGCIAIPPAMVNAAVDALAPFGITHLDMPLTPERLCAALTEPQSYVPNFSACGLTPPPETVG